MKMKKETHENTTKRKVKLKLKKKKLVTHYYYIFGNQKSLKNIRFCIHLVFQRIMNKWLIGSLLQLETKQKYSSLI